MDDCCIWRFRMTCVRCRQSCGYWRVYLLWLLKMAPHTEEISYTIKELRHCSGLWITTVKESLRNVSAKAHQRNHTYIYMHTVNHAISYQPQWSVLFDTFPLPTPPHHNLPLPRPGVPKNRTRTCMYCGVSCSWRGGACVYRIEDRTAYRWDWACTAGDYCYGSGDCEATTELDWCGGVR